MWNNDCLKQALRNGKGQRRQFEAGKGQDNNGFSGTV